MGESVPSNLRPDRSEGNYVYGEDEATAARKKRLPGTPGSIFVKKQAHKVNIRKIMRLIGSLAIFAVF